MAESADKIEELENAILGQIGMLNDLSVMSDKEQAKELIERSKAMAELAGTYIDVQRMRIEEQKVRIDAVKVMHDVSTGFKGVDKNIQHYLGIESDGANGKV